MPTTTTTATATTTRKRYEPRETREPRERVVWTDGLSPEQRQRVDEYLSRYPEPGRAVPNYRGGGGRKVLRMAVRLGMTFDEINSEVFVGVIRAAQKYDQTHPSAASFDTYAMACGGSELSRVVAKTIRELGRGTESLDVVFYPDSDRPVPREVACPKTDGDDRWAADRTELVAAALESIPPRLRDVVERKYGMNGHHPQTLREIAGAYGITKSRAGQLSQDAVKALRDSPAFEGYADE